MTPTSTKKSCTIEFRFYDKSGILCGFFVIEIQDAGLFLKCQDNSVLSSFHNVKL